MSVVSIVVPVYNAHQYIQRCLESIINQSYSEVELLLVDDGSSDDSLALCENIAAKDSRVRVISQTNQGASSARNKGLDLASGKYLFFVDSDDWIDPDMIEYMINIIRDYSDVQVVQSFVPNDMNNQIGDRIMAGAQAIKCLLEGGWWGPYCKLIRRESIGELRFPERTISEDYLFNYQLFSKIDKLYYLDKSFYHRTDRPESLSKLQLSKRKFDEFYNVKEVSDRVRVDFPQYKDFADSHLAGTCLKLLYLVFQNRAEEQYAEELNMILDCVRSNYSSFLKNKKINHNQRILLSACYSKLSARISERVYHLFR